MTEDCRNFAMSKREFNLVKEVLDEFLLSFPDAHDVVAFSERLTDAYHKGFEL